MAHTLFSSQQRAHYSSGHFISLHPSPRVSLNSLKSDANKNLYGGMSA